MVTGGKMRYGSKHKSSSPPEAQETVRPKEEGMTKI